jgi:UDP-N-acetylmuramoylalanine--D-glutamate ligase
VITARAFAGKHYAVYGLARSGVATVEALLASGAKVTAWMPRRKRARPFPPSGGGRGKAPTGGMLDRRRGPSTMRRTVPLPGRGGLSHADLNTADLTSSTPDRLPGVRSTPTRSPPRPRGGLEIIGDIELFAARARAAGRTRWSGSPAPTASRPRRRWSTTSSRPRACRRRWAAISAADPRQDPLPEGGVYVLELSSYQIDLTYSLDCDVAVLLNITPEPTRSVRELGPMRGESSVVRDADGPQRLAVVDRSSRGR